jgi:hypothetical protein
VKTIDILCPSRGRPHRFREMAESAIALASHPDRVSILLLVDHDDPELATYQALQLDRVRLIINRERMGCQGLLNTLALHYSNGDLLMAGSDDIVFRTGAWDDAFDAAFEAVPDQLLVAYTNDGRDRDKCEHFVVSRRWVEIVGCFMWPRFEHFSGDGWVEDVARRVDRLKFLREVVTEHMHFKYQKAARDEGYASKRGADAEGRSMSDRDLARMAETEPLRAQAAVLLQAAIEAA